MPLRQVLLQMPIPKEVQERFYKLGGGKDTVTDKRILEMLMLSYYYGGQDVAAIRMKDELIVVAAGIPGEGRIRKALDVLTLQQHSKVHILTPEVFDDDTITAGLYIIDEEEE